MQVDTLMQLRKFEVLATKLDQQMIADSVSNARRELIQVETRPRSDNYVRRCAGLSQDVRRLSRSTQEVRWFFATALNNANRILAFRNFWEDVFDYAGTKRLAIVRDFLDVDEELGRLLAQVRRAHSEGDTETAVAGLMKIREEADQMLCTAREQLRSYAMKLAA